jgi:hypothetical protein
MTTSESVRPFPEWPLKYQEALLEADPKKLSERVAETEAAIVERLQDLSDAQEGQAERQAIQDAIRALRVIKRDKLNFPDWEANSRGA